MSGILSDSRAARSVLGEDEWKQDTTTKPVKLVIFWVLTYNFPFKMLWISSRFLVLGNSPLASFGQVILQALGYYNIFLDIV